MKKIFFVICVLLAVHSMSAQLSTFYVQPYETDNAYPNSGDSNYVAINTNVPPLNKLLLYMGGTKSSPKNTTLFLNLAANLGYHAISLTYPNSISIQSCSLSPDGQCHENFRQEACYGTPLNSSINIDTLNSIYTRTIKLLQYLNTQYPSDNWGQFLNGNALKWNQVATAGHSQGAGHALYFAQVNHVDRCIMFSGANDYSNFYSRPANWLAGPFTTPKTKIFSFLHLRDEGVPQTYNQYEILDTLGMFSFYDTVLVDNTAVPFNNSRLLYTNETPQSMAIAPFHNATVVDQWTPLDNMGNPVFLTVWEYVLSTPLLTSSLPEDGNRFSFQVYPNPVTNFLNVESASAGTFFIYDLSGTLKKTCSLTGGLNVIDVSNLPRGVYFAQLEQDVIKIIVF